MQVDTQGFLDNIWDHDYFGFLKSVHSNWESHRPLLLLALSLTDGPVTELGSGFGSTPYLKKYCEGMNRLFNSYDSNQDWAAKTGSQFVLNWEIVPQVWNPCGLLFVDHAPGEHRKLVIERMKDKADIIVIHDTELHSAGNYGFEPLWPLFKYVLHYNRTGGGAGATAVSNKIDLHQFAGHSLGGFKFEI